MNKITQSTLRVYSVLEGFREGSSDILDGIAPYFEPLLRDRNGQILDPVEFASSVCETYRLNITPDIVEEFIPRFLRFGWITEIEHSKDHSSYRIQIDLESEDSYIDTTGKALLTKFAFNFKISAKQFHR